MKDESIRSIIYQTILETLQIDTIDCATAADIWKSLSKRFLENDNLIQADYSGLIHLMKCPEGEDPWKTIDKMQQLRKKLAAAGRTMQDKDYAAAILRAMPASWRKSLWAY
jgi:hypothetical protein